MKRIHSQNRLNFDFITDQLGSYKIDAIKFTKKGAILVNTFHSVGYWVPYNESNDPLLSPSNWSKLYIVGDSGGAYLALDETHKTVYETNFKSDIGAFVLTPVSD